MAEFPSLPLFTDAYLADTLHLTTEEHGAYLLLLMCAWRTRGCSLRDDDKMLARIAGVSLSKWRRMRPGLVEFFSIDNGHWHQKKLSHVYETVSKKVARNRANGALGGKAKAKRKTSAAPLTEVPSKALYNSASPQADASFLPNRQQGQPLQDISDSGSSDPLATKTKTKTKTKRSSSTAAKPRAVEVRAQAGHGEGAGHLSPKGGPEVSPGVSPEEGSEVAPEISPEISPEINDEISAFSLQAIAAAACLPIEGLDIAIVTGWTAAGAGVQADIVPTVTRVRLREEKKTGQPPRHLAYYDAAVLEDWDRKIAPDYAGVKRTAQKPFPAPAIFDASSVLDWRRFLGDAKSRFRGDYLSRNWLIPTDHPLFKPTDLGPDPCHRQNRAIPREIYEEYAALWAWRPLDPVPGN
ncbi:MAG: DUF1376 domain-containing protein [Kordiimonadaceae bacterium]|nr:DUF1376 domain-containing protein [Kordiimonadaceae bacterium]